MELRAHHDVAVVVQQLAVERLDSERGEREVDVNEGDVVGAGVVEPVPESERLSGVARVVEHRQAIRGHGRGLVLGAVDVAVAHHE